MGPLRLTPSEVNWKPCIYKILACTSSEKLFAVIFQSFDSLPCNAISAPKWQSRHQLSSPWPPRSSSSCCFSTRRFSRAYNAWTTTTRWKLALRSCTCTQSTGSGLKSVSEIVFLCHVVQNEWGAKIIVLVSVLLDNVLVCLAIWRVLPSVTEIWKAEKDLLSFVWIQTITSLCQCCFV